MIFRCFKIYVECVYVECDEGYNFVKEDRNLWFLVESDK